MTLFIIGLGVVAGLGYAISKQPDSFSVTRSATLAASPSQLFPLVNDFHAWRSWSPWEDLDPKLERTYEGPASGVNASYAWSGNGKAGAGKMTIVESVPDARIGISLVFTRPMAATNQTLFTFEPSAEGTRVTWTMHGKNTLMGKAFALVMNMDKMLGGTFEQGLTKLEQAAKQA